MDQRGSTWINRLQRHGSRVMRPDSWLTCHAFSVLARGACVHALSPFSVMAHASCVQRPGSCVMAHASGVMTHASGVMAHASGVMAHASTLHAPRVRRPAHASCVMRPRSTRPRSTLHAPRSTLHAPRVRRHSAAPFSPPRHGAGGLVIGLIL